MIYGIGTDISQVNRFERWMNNPDIIKRYFNEGEFFCKEAVSKTAKIEVQARHYAARFAAKEAFSKALGTGFAGLCLSDFYVKKNEDGKPFFELGEKTKKAVENRTGKDFSIHLSISHEKEYAVAFVIIEKLR